MTAQLVLPMSDPDRLYVAGAKIRAACRLVAIDVGHKVVAASWNCHEHTVALKIDEKNRNSIHPHEMVALKELDRRGLIQAAEDEALRPTVTDEERLKRLPGVLRRYLADEFAELIERELERP
jgi:hypothetical protein